MGGRGSSSSISKGNTNIQKGVKQINNITDEMKKAEQDMEKYVAYTSGLPEYNDETKREKYYEAQRKYNELRKQLWEQQDKTAKQEVENVKKTKQFINADGEATKRKITTTTYEKAMKKLEKQVQKNMGWDRR